MSKFRLPSRLQSVMPSQIRENMRIAQKVGAINLAQGRPDYPTAPEVIDAAISSILSGENQYSVTWGVEPLREAISKLLSDRFSLQFDPKTDITITCGVTEAIVAAMLALLEPGDEVIVLEPAHENYVPAIRFAGGIPKFVTMRPPKFEVPLEEIKKAIGPKTRALILNTPHNPSGRVFTDAEIAEIFAMTERDGIYVVSDEIYDRLVFPPNDHTAVASIAKDKELVITTGGISKVYATTGWRLGYVAASPEVSKGIRRIHDYLTICAPTPFQYAAIAALNLPEEFYENLRISCVENCDTLLAALEESGFEAYRPEGAYYLMADFKGWGKYNSADEFSKFLITQAKIAVVPGTAFCYQDRELGNQLVRFAFAKTKETLDQAVDNLRTGFSKQK